MREEIEELIFHMADLRERIAKVKYPRPLEKEYAAHKAHLIKLFDICDMLQEVTLEASASKSTSSRFLQRTFGPSSQSPTQDQEPVLDQSVDEKEGGFGRHHKIVPRRQWRQVYTDFHTKVFSPVFARLRHILAQSGE